MGEKVARRVGALLDGAMAEETFGRGEVPRLMYRLGRSEATGILTVTAARTEVLVLRRGSLCADDARGGIARLARMAGIEAGIARFDDGVSAAPPVPAARTVPLAAWARHHLEAQLDATRADELTAALAGARLSIRAELAPPAAMLDEADRRIIAAMAQPRRLDQLWPLARTPRFRLLCFLHFLRQVGGLVEAGVGSARPMDPQRIAAARVLGLGEVEDRDAIKRAYRRLARALHPDLQPGIGDVRRRELESRLAEVTAAASTLLG